MRILIDIGHPAHVHLFKNFSLNMIKNGHSIHFTVRDKEFEVDLLKYENFPFTNLGKHYKSRSGKILGLLKFNLQLLFIVKKFNPDICLSHGSLYTLLSSFILRKTSISLEDTGNNEQVRIYLPFVKAILTSTSFKNNYGEKQIYYNGYHELAYLHPNYFTPDTMVKQELGVDEKEKYFIVRFVSWEASHDIGNSGMNLRQKKELIGLLSRYGKVFISSEKKLPAEFDNLKFPLSPERMHHALTYAELYVGEGATMASECAVLGTTAVYINSEEAGSIDEQEKYGLIHHFRDGTKVFEKVQELLDNPRLKEQSIEKSKRLLKEKIDLTAFLIWFVEEWPESFKIMKGNPEYQGKFK